MYNPVQIPEILNWPGFLPGLLKRIDYVMESDVVLRLAHTGCVNGKWKIK